MSTVCLPHLSFSLNGEVHGAAGFLSTAQVNVDAGECSGAPVEGLLWGLFADGGVVVIVVMVEAHFQRSSGADQQSAAAVTSKRRRRPSAR